MATFTSFAAFARELEKAQQELANEETRRITKDMARQGQKIARRAASNDLGGDPKFSGWQPRLGTVVKRARGSQGHILLPTRSGAGPWTVAEVGRNKGNASGFAGPGVNRKTGLTSRKKDGSVRKVRAFKAKRWNGYTRGKNTASDALARMDQELPEIAEDGIRRVLRKHFDVT